MKRLLSGAMDLLFVLLLALLLAIPQPAFAQTQNHVVSPADLQRDMAAKTAARNQNLERLRHFLSSPQGRRALQTAHVNFRQVNDALPQLSDADLARLSAMSVKAQKDFAAGNINDHDLLLIAVLILALILIIVAVR